MNPCPKHLWGFADFCVLSGHPEDPIPVGHRRLGPPKKPAGHNVLRERAGQALTMDCLVCSMPRERFRNGLSFSKPIAKDQTLC